MASACSQDRCVSFVIDSDCTVTAAVRVFALWDRNVWLLAIVLLTGSTPAFMNLVSNVTFYTRSELLTSLYKATSRHFDGVSHTHHPIQLPYCRLPDVYAYVYCM